MAPAVWILLTTMALGAVLYLRRHSLRSSRSNPMSDLPENEVPEEMRRRRAWVAGNAAGHSGGADGAGMSGSLGGCGGDGGGCGGGA